MMLKCCEKCLAHSICVLKWILVEKGFEESCCPKCDEFLSCFRLNRNARWKIIHEDNLIAMEEQIFEEDISFNNNRRNGAHQSC